MPDKEQQGAMPEQPTPVSETQPAAPVAQSDLAAELEKTRLALKAANKEAADRRKRLDELEAAESKRKEGEMSELDKLNKRLQEAEAKLKAKERADAQRAVAEKVGLPAAFAERLQGETLEELEADAKKLLEVIPKAPKQPNINPTNPGGAQQGETDAQRKERVLGRPKFDGLSPTDAAASGGGVFWADKDNK